MDRGAWRAAAHGVTKSWTRLRDYRQAMGQVSWTHPNSFPPELLRYLCVLVSIRIPLPLRIPKLPEWLPEGPDPHRSHAQVHSGEVVLAPSALDTGGPAEEQLFLPVTWANSPPRFGEGIDTFDYRCRDMGQAHLLLPEHTHTLLRLSKERNKTLLKC